jgi:hypothetical protein
VAIVKNTLRDPSTNGALGREQITVKLVSGTTGGFIGSSVEVLSTTTTRTDKDGLWSQDLTPNALITPTNTYYTVTQFGETLRFIVPNTAGPFWLLDILVQSPTSPSGLTVGLLAPNNLSDVANAATARSNIGAAAASGVVGTVVYQVTDASGGVTFYDASGVEL